jgi:3D (Asp-Asp-Asp) domain-containing protein
MKRGLLCPCALLLATALLASPAAPPTPNGKFVATAYSVTGVTASGEYTHRHVLAADPEILPIGSRVRIRRAGRYSGEYVVADTGEKIVGRKIDIYIPNTAECKKFGKRVVRLKVIQMGDGTHASAHAADQAVKKEVAKDVQNGTVGRAATEIDWAAKKKAEGRPEGADAATPPATPSSPQ